MNIIDVLYRILGEADSAIQANEEFVASEEQTQKQVQAAQDAMGQSAAETSAAFAAEAAAAESANQRVTSAWLDSTLAAKEGAAAQAAAYDEVTRAAEASAAAQIAAQQIAKDMGGDMSAASYARLLEYTSASQAQAGGGSSGGGNLPWWASALQGQLGYDTQVQRWRQISGSTGGQFASNEQIAALMASLSDAQKADMPVGALGAGGGDGGGGVGAISSGGGGAGGGNLGAIILGSLFGQRSQAQGGAGLGTILAAATAGGLAGGGGGVLRNLLLGTTGWHAPLGIPFTGGFGGLAALAGLGPEHIALTGLGIAGSAGMGVMGALGAAAPLGVGMGSDLAVMSSTIADTKTLATAYQSVQTDQANATQAQQLMNAAISQFGPNSAQATAAITAWQSAVGTTTTAQVSMDQTIATLSGTTPQLQTALQNVQLAQLNVNQAVTQWGAGSSQAIAATQQLTDAQNAFNTALQQTAPGVAAEIRLGNEVAALNVQWDLASQGARVAAVQIIEAFLPVAAQYIPMIANAAQRNFALILQYIQPIVNLLQGPAANAFQLLEDIFASHIPGAMSIATSALQIFIEFIRVVSQVVDSDFGSSVTKAATSLSNFANSTKGIQEIANFATQAGNAFYDWVQLLGQIGIMLGHIFGDVPGTGTAIIKELTGFMKEANDWLASTQGKSLFDNLLSVHKEEVLQILQLIPPFVSTVVPALLLIEPPLTQLLTDLVKLVLSVTDFLQHMGGGVGTLTDWAIGITIILRMTHLMGPAFSVAAGAISIFGDALKGLTLFGGVRSFLLFFTSTISGLPGILGSAGESISALIIKMFGLQASEEAATGGMAEFDAASDANPIGLIVLAIAALVALVILLYTHWSQLTKAFAPVEAAFSTALNNMQTAAQNMVNAINGIFSKLNIPSVDIQQNAIAPGSVTGAGAGVYGVSPGTAGGQTSAAGPGTGLEALAGSSPAVAAAKPTGAQWFAQSILGFGVGPFAQMAANIGNAFIEGIAHAGDTIRRNVGDLFSQLGSIVRQGVSALSNLLTPWGSLIGSIFRVGLTFVVGLFKWAFETIAVLLVAWLTLLWSHIEPTLASIGTLFSTLWNLVVRGAQMFANTIEGIWNGITSWIMNTILRPFFTWMQNIWTQHFGWLQSFLATGFGILHNLWDNFRSGATSIIQKLVTDVKNFITTFVSDVDSTIGTWVTNLLNKFDTLSSGVTSVFQGMGGTIQTQLANGLNAGITDIDSFISAVNGLLTKVGIPALPIISLISGGGGSQTSGATASAPGGHLSSGGMGAGPGALGFGEQLGAGLGDVASMVGGIGGQCVVFLENLLGVHWPVAYASQLSSLVTTQNPVVGDVGVSSIPPYGHTFLVTGPNTVLDSNWVAPLTIGVHALSSIPDIVGYFNPGSAVSGLASLVSSGSGLVGSILGSALSGPKSALTSAVAHIPGIAGMLLRSIVNNLVNGVSGMSAGTAGSSSAGLSMGGAYATGGIALTPQLAAVAENGPEMILPLSGPNSIQQALANQTQILQSIEGYMQSIAKPASAPISSFTARQRHS